MNDFINFIKENKKFWSQFTIKNNGKKLLIEEPGRIYEKAIFAMIINQAKGYIPVWLCGKDPQHHQIIRSYFPNAEIITNRKKWLFKKLYATIIALFKFIKIFFTKDILGVHYDKVKYGDIIYDMYLNKNEIATIKKIDFKLLKIITTCIFRHIKIKNILQNGNYAGVLVSHMIGSSGIMLRVALRYGYHGYISTGRRQHLVTFWRFKKLEELDYPLKPSSSDIDQIINQLGPRFKKVFLETLKKQVAGKGSGKDALIAFSKNNLYFTNRTSFNQHFKLNPNKKNVFVMLHALNDHPHSHFKWMIFKDYYDWFIQTLEFAKTNNRVNWIFKQHPLIKDYPAKDVNFKELFSKCPDNVIYIDEDNQIDTRSLIHCADLVVTCLGKVGFELPAIGGIPSVTAGDNPYTKLDFALEPKTKEGYFEILNKADKIKKITPQAQKRAQATYIYIHKISKVKLSICPASPGPGSRKGNKNINPPYWKKVCNQYSTQKNIILKELNCYIKAVKKSDFKRLVRKI